MVGGKSATHGSIFVESFAPERMQVEVSAEKSEYRTEDPIRFRIQGDYLFGAPASDELYTFFCTAQEDSFSPSNLPDYHFGKSHPALSERPSSEVLGAGKLDDKGSAQNSCEIQDLSRFFNMVKVRISTEVEEAGSGRASRGWTTVKVHPFPYYIGLKTEATRIEPGKPVQVKGVVVNPDGSFKKDVSHLTYQLFEVSTDYVRLWDPQSNRFRWQRTQQRLPVNDAGAVTVIEGKFELTVSPETYWSDYLVEVRDSESTAMGDLVIRGWSWGETERPESPEILNLKLNKETVDYGEKVEAEALLPFPGKVLWTLELDKVLKYEWQEVKASQKEMPSEEVSRFSFTVPEGVSTLYVSALLIRSDEQYIIRRALGIKRLKVRPARHRLALRIEAPEQIRPGQELKVLIKGGGPNGKGSPFKATVAIVDEGILRITRFQSPDVYEGIMRDMALGITTSETLGWIINKALFKTGGGEEGASLEVPSFIRLVSHWSGFVESDPDGVLQVSFPVPQYFGELRVMVSAVDSTRMASAEAWVTVTTEVVVMPTVPRFLYSGDKVEFPVSLKNTTGQTQTVHLTLSKEEYSEVIDISEKMPGPSSPALQDTESWPPPQVPGEISLSPKSSRIIQVPLQANRLSGIIAIHLSANWELDEFKDTLQIPVLPNRPYETDIHFVEARAGSTDLIPAVKDWLPEYQKTRIMVTPIPAFNALHHLKYLIHYPYGCVEQTSSSLLPLVRLRPLLEIVAPDMVPEGLLDNMVQSGIRRLISMQTPLGGFAFWPGGIEPAPWPSVYATFVLLEAKDAGYLVPEPVLKQSFDYIEQHVQGEAFGYFVLARGGRLQPWDLGKIHNLRNRTLISEERLFLAGALSLIGERATADHILFDAAKTYTPAVPLRRLSGNFYSGLRENAVRLYIQELIHPGADKNARDTLSLIQKLGRKSYYYSTQELAWTMLALGLRIRNTTYAEMYEAAMLVNDAKGDPQGIRRAEPQRVSKEGFFWLLRSAASLQELKLVLKSEGTLYAIVENGGFKRDSEYKAFQENGLRVEKSLLDLDGNPAYTFRQGKNYLVKITLRNDRGWGLENVAVEDFIPAGFEVQNPRLPGSLLQVMPFKEDRLFTPEYVDYRDERIQAFGSLAPGTTVYVYMVRAVTSGEFMLPPVRAMAMYDPEIRAAGGVASIQVERP